jgi:hypothetical protein
MVGWIFSFSWTYDSFFAFLISFPEHLPDAPHLKTMKKKSSKTKATDPERESTLQVSVINSEITDFLSIHSGTTETKSEDISETQLKKFCKKMEGMLNN